MTGLTRGSTRDVTDKYIIRVWFEWGAGGPCFWPGNEKTQERFGYPIDPKRLPLTEETAMKAIELGRWHDTRLNWEEPNMPLLWKQAECDRFNQAYQTFLEAVISELGDNFVVVDEQGLVQEDPDLAEWLEDPDTYWERRSRGGRKGIAPV
jgi:hypothetical protein